MFVVLSLLAATAFGLGTVHQQKGTLQDDGEDVGVHFLVTLIRRPVWLAGGVLTAVGGPTGSSTDGSWPPSWA